MIENEKSVRETRQPPPAGKGKSLVYLSVSFARKPPHNKTTQSIKITSRLLSEKIIDAPTKNGVNS